MASDPTVFEHGDCREREVFLAERVYVFNARATGRFDGESFAATRSDDSGATLAGNSGYTWGHCCWLSYLWVIESHRGQGLGRSLLLATEAHARAKGCRIVLVSSHSLQAPGFHERLGYERQALVQDHPIGHTNILFVKHLAAERN